MRFSFSSRRSLRWLLISLAASTAALRATEPRMDSLFPNAVIPFSEPQIMDLDGDGMQDIVFPFLDSHSIPRGNAVWLRRLGPRSFAPAKIIARPVKTDNSMSLTDIDGDSHPDIFLSVVDPTDPSSALPEVEYLDQGAPASSHTLLSTQRARLWLAADLNGQPGAELLAENLNDDDGSSGLLSIYGHDASGNLSPWNTVPLHLPGIEAAEVTALDIDGDGDVDFAIKLQYSGTILFERQDSAPGEPLNYVPHAFPNQKFFADLDGDGQLDEIDADGSYRLMTSGSGGLQAGSVATPPIPFPEGYDWTLQNVESRPGAGATLVYSGDPTDPSASKVILKTTYDRWITRLQQVVPPTTAAGSSLVIKAVTDLDGDGFDDVLIEVNEQSPILVYLPPRYAIAWGSATGYSAAQFISDPTPGVTAAIAADLDGDGDLDLVVTTSNGKVPLAMLNDGHGAFPVIKPITGAIPVGGLPAGTTIAVSACADMDGDHIPDLVLTYTNPATQATAMTIALGRGDGTFISGDLPIGALDFAWDTFDFGGQVIDWNGDGDPDLIGFGGWRENLGGYLSEDWHPVIGGGQVIDFFGNPATIGKFTAGDLDGDGHTDMVSMLYTPAGAAPPTATNPISGVFGVAFSDAYGVAEQIAIAPISMSAVNPYGEPAITGDCWITDLNLDGHNDLLYVENYSQDFLGNPTTILRWKRNPGGGSRDIANWLTTDLDFDTTGGLVWADFDGDGTKEWCTATSYIKPTHAGPAIGPIYDFVQGINLGYAKVLAVGDFDGDGDLDSIRGEMFEDLTLVRNLIVDENSGVSRSMRASGVLGEASNPDADPDGDGLTNMEELLLGSNPAVADKPPLNWLTPRLNVSGSLPQVTFRVRNDATALGFKYLMEGSADLKTWSSVDASSAVLAPVTGAWQDATVTLPEGSPLRFFRLRAIDAAQ